MDGTCIGVCGGRAGWLDPETGLACTVCHGSGRLPVVPTIAEEWAAVSHLRGGKHVYPIRRPRFGRMPIVSGYAGARKESGGRVRRTARVVRAEQRAAARRREAEEFAAFRRSRPASWDADLDRLKADWLRGEDGKKRKK